MPLLMGLLGRHCLPGQNSQSKHFFHLYIGRMVNVRGQVGCHLPTDKASEHPESTDVSTSRFTKHWLSLYSCCGVLNAEVPSRKNTKVRKQSQANISRLKFRSENPQSNTFKAKLTSKRSQVGALRRKFQNGACPSDSVQDQTPQSKILKLELQGEVPSRNKARPQIPSESSRVEDRRRKFASERSEATIIQLRFAGEILQER